MSLSQIPVIDASLNTASALLLAAGYYFIRRKNVKAHKACMLTAVMTSSLFLVFYLTYHYHHGSTRFQGTGVIRGIYFTILISHSILAVVQAPLILMTLYRAFRGDLARHKTIAVITLPVWRYVSVTGVIVYWMLYKLGS